MKIPKNEIPAKIKISGLQLEELQKQSFQMTEAFGLDRKIENYKGTRAITLYRWDIECITDILNLTLKDSTEYPDKNDIKYKELEKLNLKLKELYKSIE
jgi:hypothetical protein